MTGVRNFIRSGVPRSGAVLISCHKDDRIFKRYDIVDAGDMAVTVRKAAEHKALKRTTRGVGSHTFSDANNGRYFQQP